MVGLNRLPLISFNALFLAAVFASPTLAQHPAPGGTVSPPSHEHRFSDAERWSKIFDDPARDAWQKPDEVIRALSLKEDARVADIGAGTGYFTVRLARAAPKGTIFAADIEPDMVRHLAHRAKGEGLANIRAVQAAPASPNLPEPVDLVLVVDTYHHIARRADYFRKLKASLRAEGRVAIIDFKLDARHGPPRRHRLSAERIAAEMKKAGYRLARTHDFLPDQSFLVFTPK